MILSRLLLYFPNLGTSSLTAKTQCSGGELRMGQAVCGYLTQAAGELQSLVLVE